MKTKLITNILLTLTLAFVLGSAITPLHGGAQPTTVIGPPPPQLPVVTINTVNSAAANGGIEVVTRGNVGTLVLSETSQSPLGTTFVNFSVGGTAIPGVDYVPLVSPASIGSSPTANSLTKAVGFGVILVKTLPDPRASFFPQAYSVVVALEPGPGYIVGQPSKAEILIEPSASSF